MNRLPTSLVILVFTAVSSRHPTSMNCHALHGSTVVVGLNAALQKRFVLSPDHPTFVPGSVHRAARVEEGIGGKGQDVAIALSCLANQPREEEQDQQGRQFSLLLAQFVGGGAEGDLVMKLLESRLGSQLLYGKGSKIGEDGVAEGSLPNAKGPNKVPIQGLTVRTKSKMRTCTTIVATDCSTELVEPSGVVEPEELSQLLERIEFLAKESADDDQSSGAASALCIMGSMPPGACGEETYADIASRTVDGETLCLIDSVVGLAPLLRELASKRRLLPRGGRSGRALFKVNISELCKLSKVTKTSGGEKDVATEYEILSAVRGFLSEFGADATGALSHIAITDGKHPAHLVEFEEPSDGTTTDASPQFRLWKMDVPHLESKGRLLYPIGAGDTVAAGTLAALLYLHSSGRMCNFEDDVGLALTSKRKMIDESCGGDVACAFLFGLACASASCLNQENSVFDVQDALKMYSTMDKPSKVPTCMTEAIG